jgi:Peptidase family U32
VGGMAVDDGGTGFPSAARLGVPEVPEAAPDSGARFPDGAELRIEIPSVEGPQVMEGVIDAARRLGVVVNRVSQGSGGMLLTAAELRAMAEMGHDEGIEVCLFVGPKAGWDGGVLARSPDGKGHYAAVRGTRGLRQAVADVERACESGIRGFLVADVGLLDVLGGLVERGHLPPCTWKVSAYLGVDNPATVAVLERLGAGTLNVPNDLTTPELAEMRAATTLPLDVYVESPDSMGGTIRLLDLAEMVRVAAPLHAKLGLRNMGSVYPSGDHTVDAAERAAREKVRRAAIALEWLARTRPSTVQSAPHAAGLALPEPPGPGHGG